MKNEKAWIAAGQYAGSGNHWAICDLELRDRIATLENSVRVLENKVGVQLAMIRATEEEPDYESWVGDLVVDDGGETTPRVLEGVTRNTIGVAYGRFDTQPTWEYISNLRLATDSERRAYTGTPPTEAGQWCMVRHNYTSDWFGPKEYIAHTKSGSACIVHHDENTIGSWRYGRLCTPFELRQAGRNNYVDLYQRNDAQS